MLHKKQKSDELNTRDSKKSDFWENLWCQNRFAAVEKPYLLYLFNKHFPAPNKLNILDIGCGAHNNCKSYFNDSDSTIVNFDISQIALNTLKKGTKNGCIPINSYCEFVQGTALSLPFADEMFDIIINTQCLHYFKDSEQKLAFKELRRVCKKGGYYIIAVKNLYAIQSIFFKMFLFKFLLFIPFYPFTYKQITEKLSKDTIVNLFGYIKIPLISSQAKINKFLNKTFSKSKVSFFFSMDIIALAKKC
ncbi:MAG: class I SAM-dependent methyltransferase [Candidatus Omnitrophica bacterium]|nr:class I SAM-dependent methyltransferase [Candidatus Omnitrophota bacterium]